MKKIFIMVAASILITSCAVIRPGEAGIKQRLGKLDNKVTTQGTILFNPFTSKVIKESIQTNNLKLALRIPSKEGLSIDSEISILYRLDVEMVPKVLANLGPKYEDVVAAVFRSASSDVCSQFLAKDMHSGKRADIEKAIKNTMEETLTSQGVIIEAVLMKSIRLPERLSLSIEQKLQAEQEALRMEFILQRERLEADRKLIDATGTRDAQKILAEGLTPEIIKIRSIEAFIELSKSANAKVIITDGKTPYLINGAQN